jgi:ABC-type multidrug transport system ATPase subunit
MQLEIKDIGKQYNRQWLFRHVSFTLQKGQSMAVTGRNGSGKSTLMQVIYGLVQASEGEVHVDGVNTFDPHRHFAISSPYMELPPEFSITEIHRLYRDLGKTEMDITAFLEFSEFAQTHSHKPVKQLSSGMQQRLKTSLCMSSSAGVILLDEPLTNMDREGETWYRNCLDIIKPRICIIAGNSEAEYAWADRILKLG